MILKTLIIFAITALTVLLYSCTLSFQNFDTHGPATDLVDENQGVSPEVKATIPLIP